MRTAAVITVSTRASQGVYQDLSGPILMDGLSALGFDVADVVVVADDSVQIADALKRALDQDVDVIITTGGTGISPSDLTPEVTKTLLTREVPGIAEALRAFGRTHLATVDLSRGLAGMSGKTLIINLAGSTGAVRDGLKVLEPLLNHAIDQIHGGDHG